MHTYFAPSMALSREMLDFQLSPSKSAKDAEGALTAMVTRTQQARENPALQVRQDISYGPRPRAKMDVFRPTGHAGQALPCLVFIHGGFWQEGDKSVSGFAAETFARLGWAWVSLGYTLTPEVSLTELTTEICDGLAHLRTHAQEWGVDPNRIILAGHSAGGHLTASVLADVLGQGAADHIAGAVLISGVFELAPVARSYVNDLARLSAEEVQHLSPARYQPQRQVPVHMLYGADEPEAFKLQSEGLYRLWAAALPRLSKHVAPGRDHFDVLDELNDPTNETMRRIADML